MLLYSQFPFLRREMPIGCQQNLKILAGATVLRTLRWPPFRRSVPGVLKDPAGFCISRLRVVGIFLGSGYRAIAQSPGTYESAAQMSRIVRVGRCRSATPCNNNHERMGGSPPAPLACVVLVLPDVASGGGDIRLDSIACRRDLDSLETKDLPC
jgi:hypothetical protein